jgi:uncharacterized protein YpiB (UPF0302 family)
MFVTLARFGGEGMIEIHDKHTALVNFGFLVRGDTSLVYMLGFLAGRLANVHFCRSIEGAGITLKISARNFGLWPLLPFAANIHGVPIPDPAAFISAMAESDEPIFAQLDFDSAENSEWYGKVLVDNPEVIANTEAEHEERIGRLRREIDRTLDIYQECLKLRNSNPGEREIPFFIEVAQKEMRRLSRKLDQLEADLSQD